MSITIVKSKIIFLNQTQFTVAVGGTHSEVLDDSFKRN